MEIKNKYKILAIVFIVFISGALVSLKIIEKDSKNYKYTFKQGVNIAHWTDGLFTGRTYGDSLWFAEKDVKWIANQGLDHLQIRISGSEISNKNASLNKERLAILDSVILWGKKENLGTILTLMSFPKFKIDTTQTKVKQTEIKLQKQVAFWESLASYFSEKESNVRFNINDRINRLTDDISYLNKYNKQVLKAIRKTNPTRKVYLLAFNFDRLNELQLPANDTNICITTGDNYGASEVFMYRNNTYDFPENFPLIKFPSKLPNFTTILEKDHWAQEFSNVTLDENYIDAYFEKASIWLKTQNPALEFYIPAWGYYTGYPFEPKSVEDSQSIVNYSQVFYNACKKYDFGFAIYDYNSGMPIHYTNNEGSPKNNNGEPSILLQAIKEKFIK